MIKYIQKNKNKIVEVTLKIASKTNLISTILTLILMLVVSGSTYNLYNFNDSTMLLLIKVFGILISIFMFSLLAQLWLTILDNENKSVKFYLNDNEIDIDLLRSLIDTETHKELLGELIVNGKVDIDDLLSDCSIDVLEIL